MNRCDRYEGERVICEASEAFEWMKGVKGLRVNSCAGLLGKGIRCCTSGSSVLNFYNSYVIPLSLFILYIRFPISHTYFRFFVSNTSIICKSPKAWPPILRLLICQWLTAGIPRSLPPLRTALQDSPLCMRPRPIYLTTFGAWMHVSALSKTPWRKGR